MSSTRPFIDLLSRAAQTMLSVRDANAFLCRVLAAAAETTRAPYGIALFDTHERNRYRAGCVKGAKACGVRAGDIIETAAGVAEIAARGVPVIIDACILGPSFSAAAPRVCLAPLAVDGRSLGLLCLGIEDLASFRSDDLGTLAAFATVAAIAIDRWTSYEKLVASEAKYRALMETGGMVVYDLRVQADGTIDPPWESPEILSATGIDTRDLRSFFDLAAYVGREGRAALLARWEKLQRGEADIREWHIRGAFGEVWLEDSIRPLEHNADGSMRLVGAARNITGLKRTERALRESEEHLRLVVSGASDPIVMTDAHGAMIFANEAVEHVFGYEPAQLVQQPLTKLIAQHTDSNDEAIGIHANGLEVPLEVSAGHVTTPNGMRTTWVLRDASRRKAEAEQQATLTGVLQRVAREWVTTFDAVAAPMLILESDLTIRRLNRAAREQFGASYGELVGRRLDEVATREPWHAAIDLCLRAAASGASETAQIHDDKHWDLFITASATEMFPRDQEFLILILHDITRLVELQEAHRRGEVLATLGSIVGGVAHEVRNPLFAISATLDAFEKEIGDRGDMTEYFGVLRGEVERLSTLMQDLLAFGKPPLREHRREHLADVIFNARLQCIPEMQARGVSVDVHCNGAAMLMDAQRMTQLFHNLIENAVQHSPAGGSVEVRAFTDRDSPHIHCQILDSGRGFTPEDLPRVFEPFYSRRNGGTGLGLALVQRIVDEHHGSIRVANRAGGGAIIDIVFPLRES